MKLRRKTFILLLIFSLTPLLLLTLLSGKVTKKMGRAVHTETREVLFDIVSHDLRETAEDWVDILVSQKTSIELALRLLSRDVERLQLQSTIYVPLEKPYVYFSKDFDHPDTAPPDAKTANGSQEPLLISYDNPAFFIPKGIDPDRLRPEMARLAGLYPLFHQLYSDMSGEIHQLSVFMNSGLFITYPGRGGLAEDYDPRSSPAYQTTLAAEGSVVWGTAPNPVTHQAVLTAAIPVYNPDDSVAGVVSADILVSHMFQTNEQSQRWSGAVSTFVLTVFEHPETRQTDFLVIAESEPRDRPAETSSPGMFQYHKFSPPEITAFKSRVGDLKKEGSGFIELPFEGVDSIWAWAFQTPEVVFLLIVPKTEVLALSDQVIQTVDQTINNYKPYWVIIFLAVVITTAVAAYYTARPMTNTILNMVDAWQRLARGDFSVRVKIAARDERALLAQSFNELAPKLEEHFRLRKALELAQEVQQNLLPRTAPGLEGFDLAGISIYCDETGGDYYDFFRADQADESRLAVLVGDVSGHGVASALLMATVRGLIRQRAAMPGEPADMVTDVNRLVAQDTLETGQFMTFFYSEFDAVRRSIRWVRAGHDPAIVYDPRTDEFHELKGRGLALGVDETFEYKGNQCPLTPGQIIVIGTDGIWEMHNETGQMFGKDTLRDVIRANALAPAGGILSAITESLDRFRGSRASEDDVTMVVVKVEG